MGIRFNTNTWRAPLQLIDSWLPPAPNRAAAPSTWPISLQRFARAGWLGRTNNLPDPAASASRGLTARATARRGCRVRMNPDSDANFTGAPSARMVISGRIGDVCDELERMAAQELKAHAPQS